MPEDQSRHAGGSHIGDRLREKGSLGSKDGREKEQTAKEDQLAECRAEQCELHLPERSRLIHERILDGKRTYTTWQEGFRRILDGLIDNRPFILNVYRSVRREQVETFLFQVTHGLLMGVVEELDPRGEVREEDKAFLADFYKYAFVGLVLDWIRTGMKGEPAELARRVELVVSGSFAQALERLRADSAHQAGPFDQN